MHSVCSPRRLFGDWNQSALWAADWVTEEGLVDDLTLLKEAAAEARVLLPPDQVVCLLPVGEPLRWSFGLENEGGRVEPGHALWLSIGERGVWLGFDGGCDALLVGMRRDSLAAWLESFRPGLAPAVRELLFGPGLSAKVAAPAAVADQIVPAFRRPPVDGPARAFWYESQVKALLALLCFLPARGGDEFFCSRQKRLARVRVTKAKAKLDSRLDEPFDLNRLAAEVGCSASYLSRTFSTTTGMTISHYLRKRRIERAADLLLSGRYNVSEVAVEVGYQSLSHFSKAFQQVKGCLPSKFEAA